VIPWLVLVLVFAEGFAISCVWMSGAVTEECANQAVSDKPELWWLREIELAKGRKAAREVRGA
jgi:hypothetical protein